jgi:hypothetical protein
MSSIEQIYGNLQEKSNDEYDNAVHTMAFFQEINQEEDVPMVTASNQASQITTPAEPRLESHDGAYYYTDQMVVTGQDDRNEGNFGGGQMRNDMMYPDRDSLDGQMPLTNLGPNASYLDHSHEVLQNTCFAPL